MGLVKRLPETAVDQQYGQFGQRTKSRDLHAMAPRARRVNVLQ